MDRFNEVYKPDKTDIETKLPFLKKGTGAYELSLGNFCPAIHLKGVVIDKINKFQALNSF